MLQGAGGPEPDGLSAYDKPFSDQLDLLRDRAKDTDPDTNLRLFQGFLETLPEGVGAIVRFRAKANIGLQHLSLGDGPEAVRWLTEACDEAPDDPRSVANRTLALWVSGDAEGAYRYGRERLARDPTNETLASYLPQVAVMVPSVTDGLEGVPETLRGTEAVMVGQCVFLRGRDDRPAWWEWARSGAAKYPDSEHLRLLAAFSQVEEISLDLEAQRTQVYGPEQRERLAAAAAVLDEDWQARPWRLRSPFDDAPHTLAVAMIAHQLLHDGEAAVARAERVAAERLTQPEILQNAVMVAMSHGRTDLATRLIGMAPDDPDLAFHAAVIALQEGDWPEAVRLLVNGRVPDAERRVADTVIALAPIRVAGRFADGSATDPATLEALFDVTRDSARGLILIARVASDLGLTDLSERAFEAAVAAVPEDAHIATRLMVASYAERAGSPSTMVRILDGHLPIDGFEQEHERLAVAHANEHPHRPRNVAYFETLPNSLRRLHGISRAHASVLLDVGRVPEATSLFRRLHAEDPTDTFVTLRLVEALRRMNDAAAAEAVLRRVDVASAAGPPEFVMALAQLVMREGYAERAYPVAYDLVRRHPDNWQVVLGYAGLGLLLDAPNPMFAIPAAGPGAWVKVRQPDGTEQGFTIDDGGDLFGVRVLPPGAGIAARVAGLRRGQTFAMPKLGSDPEVWTVVEVLSKYLHLHHRVLEEFETRFPDKPGIARYTVGEDNVDAVLELVRRSAEQNARNARTYLERPLPLAVMARGLGGDAVSFAQYVRGLGGQIVTCAGSPEERTHALDILQRNRGNGAVLDPYTAWVAAEIGVLPALKAWFGSLRTPASTAAMIERMIARENDGRGRQQMTLSWHDGNFYRNEVTDEFRDQQVAALTRVRDDILAHCEVVRVLVPDETSESVEKALAVGGSTFLDAAFLAADTGTVLMSDDMRYRQCAAEAVGCDGIWMQASLLAAVMQGDFKAVDYVRAIIGLARHGHGHLALSGLVLYLVVRFDEDDLSGFRAVLRFLAGPDAEMRSHRSVFQTFLNWLWSPGDAVPALKVRAATGLGLRALLGHRERDWRPLLDEVIRRNAAEPELSDYIASWVRGHFITAGSSAEAVAGKPASVPALAKRRRRRRARWT